MDAQQILIRSESAWKIKDQWRSITQEAYDLAFPGVSPYAGDRNAPRPQDRMFDSTAVYSVINLTNRYYNEITPPGGNMADLTVGPLLEKQISKEKSAQANKELKEYNDIISMIFQTSSFSMAMWAGWLDYVVAGLGCVLMLENNSSDVEPFIFEAVSQSEVAIEEGAGGIISAVSRKRSGLKVRKIKNIWPDAIIPEKLNASKDKDPEINIIEYCYVENSVSKGENVQLWRYKVIHADNSAPVIMVDRTYNTCPFIVWRDMKIAGSPYSLSKVFTALPDIRSANKAKEMIFKNAAIAMAGMYLAADDGVLNVDNIQITNGGIIPVARTGGTLGASLVPLETGRSFDIAQIVIEELRMQIKKGLKDNQLPPLEGKVRSATEYIERQKEMTQDFGGEVPRILSELVVPLYRRAIDVASRRGYLPAMKIDQFALRVSVKTPLAKSVDVQEVEKIVQWWQVLTMLLGPQMAMAAVKMPQIVPYLSKKIGVPAELYNTDNENEALQDNIKQLVAANAMQQAKASIPQQA